MDETVPNIRFDAAGVCQYCRVHDKLERIFPVGEEGRRIRERLAERMRKEGRGKKHDCVVGVSGGRDSTFTLHVLVRELGLRPLAVHFNDGFGNPTAGENMKKATERLGVEFRTITSDWRESKDIKIAFLKASTPDLEEGTDLGIATALYGQAAKEGIRTIVIGQSFRTEGICPLTWNYLDGKYLRAVHARFGSVPLRPWTPEDPGFHLELRHMFYYTVLRRIRTVPILYYYPYVRREAEEILRAEYDWEYPGAHYYDDLYQSLMTYVLRVKFNIDRRIYNFSALVRSGQMSRKEALERVRAAPDDIEDPRTIDLCIKRLGLSRKEFEEILARPPKTFRDYPSHYDLIRLCRFPIWALSRLGLLPGTAYEKYFECV